MAYIHIISFPDKRGKVLKRCNELASGQTLGFPSSFLAIMSDTRRSAERRSVISSSFAGNYFCCLGTKCAPWQDLSGLIFRCLFVHLHPSAPAISHLIMVALLRYLDAGGSFEECVVDMVNSVEDGSHPSSRFPVPAYHK